MPPLPLPPLPLLLLLPGVVRAAVVALGVACTGAAKPAGIGVGVLREGLPARACAPAALLPPACSLEAVCGVACGGVRPARATEGGLCAWCCCAPAAPRVCHCPCSSRPGGCCLACCCAVRLLCGC